MNTLTNIIAIAQCLLFIAFLFNVIRLVVSIVNDGKVDEAYKTPFDLGKF